MIKEKNLITSFDFYVLGGEQIAKISDEQFSLIFDVIKDAYALYGNKESVNPNSYFLRFPDKVNARMIALPSYIGGSFDVAGIKWISSYPDNIKQGIQRASAVIILNDYETGYPFACLEGSLISALRTANSAVLAAECINESLNISDVSLGIVGNGFIAQKIYQVFKIREWEFKKIYLYDTLKNECNKFKDLQIPESEKYKVTICNSVEELLGKSSLIVFTTTASIPYVKSLKLLEHNPIILHISLRDLSPQIILSSYNIVDDIDHILSANTSVDLAYQQSNTENFITSTLSDLILRKVSLKNDKPIIFSPMGLGVLDLALGKHIFDKALEMKVVQRYSDFFYNIGR